MRPTTPNRARSSLAMQAFPWVPMRRGKNLRRGSKRNRRRHRAFLAGQKKAQLVRAGQSVSRAALGYEFVSDSLTSASACLVAFLDSALESAVGRSVWMALPKLTDLLPVPAGQADPLAGVCPVMSACMQAKLIPRFLLTCAAATH